MAYIGNQLSIIATTIENVFNTAVLIGTDDISVVLGANYISDGLRRGLVLGSVVWYFNGTTVYQCQVAATQLPTGAGVTLALIGNAFALSVTDGVTTITEVASLVFSGATVTSGGAGVANIAVSGGGGGNTIILTADTNIAAGTAVSVNSAGHAVQTWGAAPNIAGLVTLLAENGSPAFGVILLSGGAFVATGSLDNVATSFIPAVVSGTTISVGTPNAVSGVDPQAAVGLSGTSFVCYDAASNSLIAATISGGVITFGAAVPVPSATGAIGLAALSSTEFVLVYGTSGNDFAVAGTVSGTTITLGTGVDLGFSGSPSVYALTSTSVLFTYFDPNNSNFATARVGSLSGTTLTLHTAVAISGTAINTPANPVTAAILSATSFALAWTNSGYQAFGAAGSISGTTISLGSVEYIGWGSSIGIGGIVTTFALGTTSAVFGPFGTTPTIAGISGTILTPALGLPVPLPWFGQDSVTKGPVVAASSNPQLPAIAVFSSTEFIWMDGQWSLYEETSSGLVSPPIRHQGLSNYAMYPLTSTTVLAVLVDDNLTISARVINWAAPNASAPIGCSPSAVTSGNPATITLSGACSGFSGLTPGIKYYANGDGTLTTADTGHPMGVPITSSQLVL